MTKSRERRFDLTDLALRFVAGGGAVVLCFLVGRLSPWKAFGGMFAAFPAVMVAAVVLAGMRDGAAHAAEVASGAVSGMLGGVVCILSALFLIPYLHSWSLALACALVIWGVSSAFFSWAFAHLPHSHH